MNRESIQPLAGCAGIQSRLSELSDEGGRLPAEMREHLDSCEECAHFARLWVERAGEPIEDLMTEPEPISRELRERILSGIHAAEAGKVIRGVSFGGRWPAVPRMLPQIAAIAAIGAFAFWLLKPNFAQRPKPAARLEAKVLEQAVAVLEKPMTHEQEALRQAAIAGGMELHDTIRDSMAIFQ
jgi:hypothetical protein